MKPQDKQHQSQLSWECDFCQEASFLSLCLYEQSSENEGNSTYKKEEGKVLSCWRFEVLLQWTSSHGHFEKPKPKV